MLMLMCVCAGEYLREGIFSPSMRRVIELLHPIIAICGLVARKKRRLGGVISLSESSARE